MKRTKIGRLGEHYAAQFLVAQNHYVLAHNYYCPFGEIDLVTVDRTINQLCFVEVKTRTNTVFGQAEDSITYQKKQHLIKCAFHFLQNKEPYFPIWRIDLIAVKLNENLSLLSIRYLKNILDGE